MLRVLLVIPGLALLFAGVYCLLGRDATANVGHVAVLPWWLGALGCIAGLGVIIYGAGRRKF